MRFKLFFLIGILFFTLSSGAKSSVAKFKPLILQWELSNFRNVEQISLVFFPNKVNLVVNTSHYQSKNLIYLGKFHSNLTKNFRDWMIKAKIHYVYLKNTVPTLSVVAPDSKPLSSHVAHTPIIRINEQTLHPQDTNFELFEKIIRSVWAYRWSCLECAFYQKKKNKIVRVVQNKVKKTKKKKIFSNKQFKCLPKGKGRIECLDSRWGTFYL